MLEGSETQQDSDLSEHDQKMMQISPEQPEQEEMISPEQRGQGCLDQLRKKFKKMNEAGWIDTFQALGSGALIVAGEITMSALASLVYKSTHDPQVVSLLVGGGMAGMIAGFMGVSETMRRTSSKGVK